MKFAKINMVALTALVAIGASGCASTDPSEKYNYEPRVLPVITVDAEWDDSKSYAMNKLIQMGYEPNVVDAVDLKDSAHTYSGGERFLSGALSYMGIGLMGAVADASQTKKINEEAARIPYTALLDVPDDVLEADTPQQQFIQVRDYVAQRMVDAFSTRDDKATLHLVATDASKDKFSSGILYYTSSQERCLIQDEGSLSSYWLNLSTDFSSDHHNIHHVLCAYPFDLSLVQHDEGSATYVRVGLEHVFAPVINGLFQFGGVNEVFFAPPAIKRLGKARVRGIPYIAENGVAHFFTLDNATEKLKFTNNEEG